MASFLTNYFAQESAQGDVKIGTDTFKVLLLKTATGADRDLDFIGDFIGAGCVEADATNYTGGFAGAGRKTVALTAAQDDTNNRANVTISAAITWTGLGGASNNTIVAALLVKEVTNDAASPVVAFFDLVDTPTNGSDYLLTWTASLVMTLTT